MKKLILIFIPILLISCIGLKSDKNHRLILEKEKVKKVILNCGQNRLALDPETTHFIIDKINTAKQFGLLKGIVRQDLRIFLNNTDTINIRLIENKFKWDKSGDWAYELDIADGYFDQYCREERLKVLKPAEHSLSIQNPIKTIERIFNQYNEFQESTDSQSNLDSLSQALKILESQNVNQADLTLIINVWMYYTVTDFSSQELTENVLQAHKTQSISAIKNRMKNKMEWETDDGAPFSELSSLLEKIERR